MKQLTLLCLCLALVLGSMVLPADVFGYVVPDVHGVRVDTAVPISLLPQKMRDIYPANTAWNVTLDYLCKPVCEDPDINRGWLMYDTWALWAFAVCYCDVPSSCMECPASQAQYGSGFWCHEGCAGRQYNFTRVQNYDACNYDYDGDGIPDCEDPNSDTPPPPPLTGCYNDNTNTEYDNKQAETQGASAEVCPTCGTGMPGLLVNLSSLNFVLKDTDIAYPDHGRTIEIQRYYNALSTDTGIFGRGWTFNYGVRLVIDAANVTVERGTGAKRLFTCPSAGTCTPPKAVYDKLTKNADGTFSLWTKRDRLTYAFTATGVLSSVIDSNNNAVTLAYDGGGRLTTITDASGRTISFTYSADKVQTITDPIGRHVTFTYDGNGNMYTSKDLAEVTTTFIYDANNYLMSMATLNGTTSFTYQDYAFGRRLASVIDAEGHTTHYAIDAPSSEVLVTDPRGYQTHYGYNYDGYTTYVTDPLTHKTAYGYDANGNRTSITDANTKQTTISYDTRGNITSITDPLAKTATFTYDTRDNLTQAKDPLNRQYTFTYDAHDNLTMITDPAPLSYQTNFVYDAKGELTSLTDARSKTSSFAYDQYGNLSSITDPLAHSVSFTYNLIGKRQSATDLLEHTTNYEYDPLGRLTRIIHPDTTDFIIHRYCSGISGITDENDLYTGYEHDHINQLKKIIYALTGYETDFGYDGSGNLTSLIDPKGQGSGFEYFENDWLKKTTYPEGATESYTYYPVGTLKTRTDGKGVVTTYGYDYVHRLTSITAPDLSIGYTYDAVGNLDIMTDATGTTDYDFDELHRLKKITYPNGKSIDYTYDEVGNLKTIGTPFAFVTYTYYDNNLLKSIDFPYDPNGMHPPNQQVTYHYDEANNLTRIDYPNGTYTVYAYDTRNRLTAMTNYGKNNTVISTYAYTLDGVGNRTRTDLNEPMMPSYNSGTTNSTYTGNILHTADGNTYTHDANGNRIQKSGSAGTTTYTYDSLNRLVQTVKGAQTTQYLYNGLGQRVAKIDNGVRTNYLVDHNGILPQVLEEMDASNNLIAFYVYDGAGLVAKVTPSKQYYYYHYDGLGSTIAITNSAGQVVNSYAYSPEGLVGVQETIPNPFQYVGRFGVMAEGNGLYFMGARYYDPEVGRFINKDPIGYAGGLNLYSYVGNNSPTYIDPLGLLRFKLFDMPIDLKVSLSFLPINITWDLGGFSANNFSYNGIFPPLTAGIGVDISINPPASCEKYISPYVGFRNWGWGTNVSLVSKGKEPIKLKVQGVNISFGPSVGLPIGATIPGGFEDNEQTWDRDGLKDRRFDKK